MKLAYLGPPGTFGEIAARAHAPSAELIPVASHAAVVTAVSSQMAALGVIPVENSVEGSVNETLDLMIHESTLSVRAEVVVSVEQCLLVQPGADAASIVVIHSHPQALGQCRAFLERCFPKASLTAALSTAAAVEAVFERPGVAAIASARAAEIRGAEILARNIQDRKENLTRFWVLATQDAPPTGRDKTSIAFKTAHDRPGTLVEVLAELASRDINLTKIESRPSKDALGVYVFLVDFEGHRTDTTVATALERVAERTSWLKVFGSYPRFAD